MDQASAGNHERFYKALAGLVLAGVIVNAITAWRSSGGFFSPGYNRSLNTLAFFTIQSNLLVGISALWLWLRTGVRSTLFSVVWLSGLVGISITGIVYHWLLAPLHDPRGLALIGDLIVHSAVPILAVVGFFVFGPRGLITPRIASLTLVYLAVWGAFTLIRGEIVNWYPYPFVDVNDKGYSRVIANGVGLAIMYLAVGFGYMALDRMMTSEPSLALESEQAD